MELSLYISKHILYYSSTTISDMSGWSNFQSFVTVLNHNQFSHHGYHSLRSLENTQPVHIIINKTREILFFNESFYLTFGKVEKKKVCF